MYYAKELFVKRGPLATLWLAGSLLRKVTKTQILQADVQKMCDVVSAPPVALALPTQSTLLRGVVRIENKKAIYLLEDCEHTTVRLAQPRAVREGTTLDAKKIRAKHDTITYTDEDQALLAEEGFPGMAGADEVALFVEGGGGDAGLFDWDMSADHLTTTESAAYESRAEDITLGSEDLGGIGFDESLEFGAIDQEMALGDFGEGAEVGAPLEVELGIGGEVPPSPAISEIAAIELDLEAYAMPQRGKPKKKKRAFVPVIDEAAEMDDATVRRYLHDTADLVMSRPLRSPTFMRADELQLALQQPSAFNPAEFSNVPMEFIEMMERECRAAPIVDVAGHTAAEIEEEFGGERGWEFESGGDFTGDISEGRERDFEAEIGGVDESLLSVGVEEEVGGLFAEISQAEEARRRGRPSKPIELVSELETPEVGVPESQFELPYEEAKEKLPRATIERRAVNKHTEIFRIELEKKFSRLSRAGQPPAVVFDPFLSELLSGAPQRRDRALAFYQLLVLTSLEVIRVSQEDDFGDIEITKGINSSQMFGSTTPSQ